MIKMTTNINMYIPYMLAFIILLTSMVIDDELSKFMIFIILLIIYIIKRYDSRILIKFSILFIIFSAAGFILKDEIVANQIVIYSYYFLVIGVILQLVEYVRYMKRCYLENEN